MGRKKQKRDKQTLSPPVSASTLTKAQAKGLQRALQLLAAGNVAQAEADLRALVAQGIRNARLYSDLATICARTGRWDEAGELWRKALRVEPTLLEAQMNLAECYQRGGDLAKAASLYRQVLAERSDLVAARYLLGNILKAQGELAEAAACYKAVLEREPAYTQAHFTYAGIHRYKESSDPHLMAMLNLYEAPVLKDENRIHLAFALGKAFEDLGDYSRAFDYLETGNELRFREFNYSIDGDKALIDSIIRAFNHDAVAERQITAQNSDRPIFIVGMPRSGTSLVEKILASHSDVHGAGELDYLFALGTSRFLSKANNFQYPSLDTYPRTVFEEVGESYLEQIARLNQEARFVTDKMPFNMMMLGLIRIALPNATIIHCVRDARDTCLSIFKQNFSTGNYRFAYNLKTVAQFYNEYARLMEHWHAALPGAIYDVHYEALAQDPEVEIPKLLAACGLEFQDACLHFDKSKAVVRTASAFQVRQPMYTSSVSLWKKYEEFLTPMLSELKDT